MRPANLQEAKFKMKAKSLHYSKSGSVQPIASEIGRVMQCVCDQIPPAYPCEGEKVVFIGSGGTDGLDGIIAAMKANGVETYGKPLGIAVKGGFFKKGTPTDEDIKKALAWADEIAKM